MANTFKRRTFGIPKCFWLELYWHPSSYWSLRDPGAEWWFREINLGRVRILWYLHFMLLWTVHKEVKKSRYHADRR